MTVRHPVSVEKTMKQLAVVSKHDIVVNGTMNKCPSSIALSPTFWRKYTCNLNCGACCLRFTLDYTHAEALKLVQQYPSVESLLEDADATVNGRQYKLVRLRHQHDVEAYGKEWCSYVDRGTGGCTIHEANPLSCRIELMKFWQSKDRGYIGKKPFGRAWNMKRVTDGEAEVLCEFDETFSERQFREVDLPVLHDMLTWAEYFDIDTHLSTIIRACEECVKRRTLRTFVIDNTGGE